MSALDACEPQIIRAFEKDGWRTIEKPVRIRISLERMVYADISMERRTNGHAEQIVILEIKCFANAQAELNDLYTAIGQYLLYRAALRDNESVLPLFLVIPAHAYGRLTNLTSVRTVLREVDIKFVIVDLAVEEIVQWIR